MMQILSHVEVAQVIEVECTELACDKMAVKFQIVGYHKNIPLGERKQRRISESQCGEYR